MVGACEKSWAHDQGLSLWRLMHRAKGAWSTTIALSKGTKSNPRAPRSELGVGMMHSTMDGFVAKCQDVVELKGVSFNPF